MATGATEETQVHNTETTETKVTFTPEQQDFVNKLLKKERENEARKFQSEISTTKTTLESIQAEYKEAQKKLENATTKGERAEASDELEALKASLNEAKLVHQRTLDEVERHKRLLSEKEKEVLKAQNDALNTRKEVAIQRAASKINFFDLGAVQKLTQDQVKWDETYSRFVVLNDEGTARMNSSFEPMTLEEYYGEYAAKNPFLVRGSVQGGAGSAESQRAGVHGGRYQVDELFGPNGSGKLANEVAKRDMKEYMRLRTEAVAKGYLAR